MTHSSTSPPKCRFCNRPCIRKDTPRPFEFRTHLLWRYVPLCLDCGPTTCWNCCFIHIANDMAPEQVA